MNGGYIIISKNQADAYALSSKALELGKPILFYEDENTCYYIDTISKSGTDIVLTKGGKTITIEADGDIIETGNIQVEEKHLYKYVFSGKDDEASNFYVCVITSIYVDSIDNIDLLNGYVLFGSYQNSNYMTVSFTSLDINDTDVNIENLYASENEVSLIRSTLDYFDRIQLF